MSGNNTVTSLAIGAVASGLVAHYVFGVGRVKVTVVNESDTTKRVTVGDRVYMVYKLPLSTYSVVSVANPLVNQTFSQTTVLAATGTPAEQAALVADMKLFPKSLFSAS